MQNLILLMHAFLGYDHTSRVFGIGKGKVCKNNTMKNAFVSAASIFYQCSSRKEEVKKAGEDLMLTVLNRTKDVTLDAARLKVFMEKIKKHEVVKPESLPPTSDAAAQHFSRVYSQIQEWLGNRLPFSDWGWTIVENKCAPIYMLWLQ